MIDNNIYSGSQHHKKCFSDEHKGHKRKLLLVEDGTIYEVKRSKLENTVEFEQYV